MKGVEIECRGKRLFMPDFYGRGMVVLSTVSITGVAITQSTSSWLLAMDAAVKLSPVVQYQVLFTFLAGILSVDILH